MLLAGGGSGGHIYPLLAIAEATSKLAGENSLDLKMAYMGPNDEYAKEIASRGIRVLPILAGKIRRYFSVMNIIDIPKFFIGMLQAWFKVYALMPDIIFSKGGPGALPVVMAGWFYRIPVLIHESDASPGLTNLLSSRFARRIAVSFEEAKQYFHPQKTAITGTPVRPELLAGKLPQTEAKERLGFDAQKPLLFVVGGSQGSRRINEFIALNLGELISQAQILHQTGRNNFMEIKKLTQAAMMEVPVASELKNRYEPMAYLDSKDMSLALSAADVVLARAGSGSVFEIAAFEKPSILIPLEGAANDHQRANAYAYAKTGAALVVEKRNLSPQIITSDLKAILSSPDRQKSMSAAAKNFYKPDAAIAIAKELLRLA